MISTYFLEGKHVDFSKVKKNPVFQEFTILWSLYLPNRTSALLCIITESITFHEMLNRETVTLSTVVCKISYLKQVWKNHLPQLVIIRVFRRKRKYHEFEIFVSRQKLQVTEDRYYKINKFINSNSSLPFRWPFRNQRPHNYLVPELCRVFFMNWFIKIVAIIRTARGCLQGGALSHV